MLLLLTGCTGSAAPDRLISRTRYPAAPEKTELLRLVADVEQSGDVVVLRLGRGCFSVVREQEILGDTREARRDVTPSMLFFESGLAVFLGGVGAAALAYGVAAAYDSQFAYRDDPRGPFYNPGGPNSGLASGLVLVAGGAVLLGLATGIAISSRRTRIYTVQRKVPLTQQTESPCPARPAGAVLVSAVLMRAATASEDARETFRIGTTDVNGVLRFGMEAALRERRRDGGAGIAHLYLFAEGVLLGGVQVEGDE